MHPTLLFLQYQVILLHSFLTLLVAIICLLLLTLSLHTLLLLVLSLTLLVLALLSKMVGLSANFVIFLMLFVPLLLPLLLLLRFGGKLLLLPFIPSIGVRLLLLRTKLLMVYCLVLLPPMIYSEFLDVSVLFFFTSTNETNFSLVLVYVVFLGMVLVKKDIGVTTPLANVFVFLGMWSFVNTKCFTKSLMFLNHLSPLLIQSLIFFLRKPPYYSCTHPFYF